MVKNNNTAVNRNTDRERIPFTTYTSPSLTSHSNKKNIDEVISSLANAHENKRAQQVVEWEISQASNIHRSA